ncbi:hypothetical protein FB45DRAFT_940911 [Roridomyces roridus]|uniref:Uncharacterized protein n=1 Tax=Roridomyces roridus TaxID=1738132 RepID=A0AAD7B6Z4_9AGAR|nr:hypothetical protein FB45DRAFT_940911 [Roridomyces roridus]
MSIPAACILEAAGRAWGSQNPVSDDRMRNKFEWAWGLERGTFDHHVSSFVDAELLDIFLDENLVLVAERDLIKDIYRGIGTQPWSFCSKKRVMIQKVYNDRESFEYLVLPVDPCNGVALRTIISPIPPHLILSYTTDKILRRAGNYGRWHSSLVDSLERAPESGVIFELNPGVFSDLQFMHKRWALTSVPPRFLGLEVIGSWEHPMLDSEDDSDKETGSSTMEWDPTFSDEPQRRLREDELQQDPVIVWPRAAEDDDAISWDSHITGVEDPDEYAKASMARGDYSEDQAWLKGVENWADNASVVDDERVLLNDADIEAVKDYHEEQSRAASSVDLEKPDYYRLWRFSERAPEP